MRLQKSLYDAHLFIFTVLIGNNIAIYLLSRQVTNLYLKGGLSAESGGFSWNAETAAAVTLMLPVFIFAELLPKNLFRTRADSLMYRCSGLLQIVQKLFSPLTIPLKWIFHLMTAGRVPSEALSGLSLSVEGLREYFSGEALQQTLTDHQHGMIDKVVSMHATPVQEIMTPWQQAVSISERATVRQTVQHMKESDMDILLVFRGPRRNLIGFVRMVDLLDPGLEPAAPVRPVCRVMQRIAEGTSLSQAFRSLRQSPDHPVLVMDRPGKVGGVLRLRDVADYIASES